MYFLFFGVLIFGGVCEEVAPGPVGEESGAGRRGEAAVPANPGGLLRWVVTSFPDGTSLCFPFDGA